MPCLRKLGLLLLSSHSNPAGARSSKSESSLAIAGRSLGSMKALFHLLCARTTVVAYVYTIVFRLSIWTWGMFHPVNSREKANNLRTLAGWPCTDWPVGTAPRLTEKPPHALYAPIPR